MKRSKVFLGITTCILAIGALAASKAKNTIQAKVYSQANNRGNCVAFGRVTATVTPSAGQTAQTSSGNNLYTVLHNCTTLLYVGN